MMKSSFYTLDPIDRRIIAELSQNGRLSNVELAERVGLSPSPCWTRVKRLEKNGVIEGYAAIINHKALGLPEIVFVEIKLNHHSDEALEEFSEALKEISEVLEAFIVSGDHDYLIKLAVPGTEGYEKLLRKKLFKIRGFGQTKSTFVLRALRLPQMLGPDQYVKSSDKT